MISKNDSGPAFPASFVHGSVFHKGMTLRDWFAGQVLSGTINDRYSGKDSLAEKCYEIADAMLKEREK